MIKSKLLQNGALYEKKSRIQKVVFWGCSTTPEISTWYL